MASVTSSRGLFRRQPQPQQQRPTVQPVVEPVTVNGSFTADAWIAAFDVVCTGACGLVAAGGVGIPLQAHWSFGTASGISAVTDQKPTGSAAAYQFTSAGTQVYLRKAMARRVVQGRFYFYMESYPTGGNSPFMELLNASGDLGLWAIDAAGTGGHTPMALHGDVGSGGGADGGTISLNTWHYIDFVADSSGSTATLKWKLDGGTEFTASNAQAAADITDVRFGLGGSATHTIWIASIVVSSMPNLYPMGPGAIEALRPNRDGTHSFTAGDFKYDNSTNVATSATDVYTYLDDPDLNDVSNYISQNVIRATGYVEVGLSSLTSTQDPIAVNVIGEYFSSGTAANTFGTKLNDGGTLADVLNQNGEGGVAVGLADVSTISTNPQNYEEIFRFAPSTGTNWTISKANALLVRAGYSTDITPIPGISGLLAEVAVPIREFTADAVIQAAAAAPQPRRPTDIRALGIFRPVQPLKWNKPLKPYPLIPEEHIVDEVYELFAIILATQSASFTADAVIEPLRFPPRTDIRALGIYRPQRPLSILPRVYAQQVVLVTQSASFTADAIILATGSATFTADATIEPQRFPPRTDIRAHGIWRAAPRLQWSQPPKPYRFFVTQSASFTADAIVLATQTATFTADGLIFKTQSASFTADAIIATTQSASFTADAVIVTTQTASFTADAVIEPQRFRPRTDIRASGVWRSQPRLLWNQPSAPFRFFATVNASFTADAVVLKTQNASFTADAVILTTQSASFTADAVILKTQSASFSADSVVLATQSASFTADAVILATISQTFTADAVIKTTQAATFTADAVIVVTATSSFTADAIVYATISASFTADAVILTTQSATFTGDSILLVTQSASFTADAVIKATITQTFTADAIIYATISQTFTADAVVLVTQSASFTVDAWFLKVQEASFTSDAVIFATISASFTADAVIMPVFTGDAIVLRTQSATFTANAVIMPVFTGDAIVLRTQEATFTADSFISAQGVAAIGADAVILATQSASFTADAIVFVTQLASLTADAVVFALQSATFTADAVILVSQSASFTADAEIRYVGVPYWTTPLNGQSVSTTTPTFQFRMPAASSKMHFWMELDTANTFATPNYQSFKSHSDLTGWEYWDGAAWQPVPQAGVDPSFSGNEARYTIQTPLANGVWFRRVRTGVI